MTDPGAPQALQHRLLVATPALGDPNFERAVVLILDHGADGAFGLVLNRRTGTPISEIVHGWGRLSAPPGEIFRGGPVSPESVIALARRTPFAVSDDASRALTSVYDDIVAVDLDTDPAELLSCITELRLYAGYAGWGAGQLESELAQNAWFVVDAQPTDPFRPDPEQLWRSVLGRQSGRLAIFARFPDDPLAN